MVIRHETDRLRTRGESTPGQMPRRPQVCAVFGHLPAAGDRSVPNGAIAVIQRVEFKHVVAEPAVPDGNVQECAARQSVPVVRGDRGAPPVEVGTADVPGMVVRDPIRVRVPGYG